MIAVRMEHAGTRLGIVSELLVCGRELLEHRNIERVPLLGPVDADEEDMPVALDRDSFAHAPHCRSPRSSGQRTADRERGSVARRRADVT
jgi:hypothetical protein